MIEYVLEAQGLSRDYGKTRALETVDWAVPPGRLTALLGPNGAGKTTLLRIMAGHIVPTEGRAHILAADATRDFDRVTGRVASLLDGHEPPNWATVNHLVRLESEAMPHFDSARAKGLLARRGIGAHKRYGALSKGQRRSVQAALALASGAEILLLDEPADGMDPEARRLLYDGLREMVNEQGASVVVATHIIHDIERVADDVAILSGGELLMYEGLEELRERVREVEIVGGAPPGEFPGATVLRVVRQAGATRLIVRMDSGEVEPERLFGPHAAWRPVNLESLYLALTGPALGETR